MTAAATEFSVTPTAWTTRATTTRTAATTGIGRSERCCGEEATGHQACE